jgi:hypothetical protein
MPIRTLLNEDHSFTPEEVSVLIQAFEGSLEALGLSDREDPVTRLVAEKVMEGARAGERDPRQLQTWVVAQFNGSPRT